jgi:hypothetical protein
MTVVHWITGYDKESEQLATQLEIPKSQMRFAKSVANVSSDDPEAALSYPLTPEQAKRIAGAINKPIDTDRYLWFLEPFADWDAIKSESERSGLRHRTDSAKSQAASEPEEAPRGPSAR